MNLSVKKVSIRLIYCIDSRSFLNMWSTFTVIGVVADTTKPSTWKHLIKNVSVIVDTSFDFANPAGTQSQLIQDVSEAVKEYPEKRYTFIYTSGTWVYGNSVGIPIDESDDLNPIPLVAWRPALEKVVIESKDFDGVVIRPGLVLGKTGSIFGVWFGAVESGQVTLYNDANVRFAVVHTNDLAETYVAAAEKIYITKGQTFNVVNRQTEYVTDLINALARLINPEAKITYQAPADPFQGALGLHSPSFDVSKAENILGFQQKHNGAVDGIERYYKAWKASATEWEDTKF
jgi:nucleoside-diphosphate-sugar epimerase